MDDAQHGCSSAEDAVTSERNGETGKRGNGEKAVCGAWCVVREGVIPVKAVDFTTEEVLNLGRKIGFCKSGKRELNPGVRALWN
jgi:hypothetical protein